MRKRTQARESSLTILYQSDITRREPHVVSKQYWSEKESINEQIREFSDRIIEGVEKDMKTIVEDLVLMVVLSIINL